AELLLERHRVLEAQGTDELEHELLGREIDHLALRTGLADLPRDGVHEMRLAEPDAAVEEERVEGHRVLRRAGAFRDSLRRGVSELVRLSGDEVLEGEAGIERGADLER